MAVKMSSSRGAVTYSKAIQGGRMQQGVLRLRLRRHGHAREGRCVCGGAHP